MSHPEPEDLAIGAVEGFGVGIERHLQTCSECRAEAQALHRVVEAGRLGRTEPWATPSDDVWARIATELDLPSPIGPASSSGPPPDRHAESMPGLAHSSEDDSPAPAGPAWWRKPTAWVAAAALALGTLGTVAVQRLAAATNGQLVASADLRPLPGWEGVGTAAIEDVEGERVLVVDLATTPEEGYREVWLISADLERLVSVGVLTGDEGRFTLPDGIDLADFEIVDVSAEPLDGDPTHSGESIVRGELT